ncbi:MAG: AsmA family protein [Shimia sp.]|uniref:AsmA family protein n=1 Tax=Shimia sp. TaxID=1954381 RepID=UPI004059331E
MSGARIPSETMGDLELANLDLLEWELNLPALMERRLDIDNLTIDGLHVNLITKADGTKSWTAQNTPKPEPKSKDSASTEAPPAEDAGAVTEDTAPPPSILSFLSDKTATITNVALVTIEEKSGFEFDFQLEQILLRQLEDGQLVSVTGAGALNGSPFRWDGDFPRDAPFTNQFDFGDISVSYNGQEMTDVPAGYTARLELDTGQIGDVFEVLGLTRSLEGVGQISADVSSRPGFMAIANLSANLDLNKGQNITVSGDIEDVFTNAGFDIRLNARLHPDGQPPPEADTLKTLKLTNIDAHVVNEGSVLKFEELLLKTNAFDQGLDSVGPISIGHIYRSEAKTLGLKDVTFQVGPEDAPYLVAEGDVGDVFNLTEVDLQGQLNAEADLLLKNLPPEDIEQFGGITADFVIASEGDVLSVRKLDARTKNTDLWALKAELVVASIKDLAGIRIGGSIAVPETAPFLSALGLTPVDVASLETGILLEGTAKEAAFSFAFGAGDTDLKTDITFDMRQAVNVVRGALVSNRMQLNDLREGAKLLVQLKDQLAAAKQDTSDASDDAGRPPIQPLVLDKKNEDLDLKRMLLDADVALSMDIKEFIGDAGTTSMSSTFTAKDGQLQAGPLELFYGPGYFKVTASMDASENPDQLRVLGETSGWDFGQILRAVDIDLSARGALFAAVDVTGNIASGKAFANSMVGSATLNMRDGAIATSLLELAGLGIFPWLVSKEFADGETEIVCVRAPVSINSGRVSFDALVVETRSVQLVVAGFVDWVRDAIAVRAEPRRVGKPLSRSAWPFDVAGALSDPKFKLDIGGSRSSRVDDADEMPKERKPCTPDIQQLQ